MPLPDVCRTLLLQADSKALGTVDARGEVNIVPVSSLRLEGDAIILVNYFFNKTLSNLKDNPRVSLVAWQGLVGYQIKATARYEETGELFESVVSWIAETIPGRLVKGVVVLTPTQCFDVSAGATAGQEILL